MRAKKFAPWSASKIQAALRCSRLFHYRYVDKVEEPEIMYEMQLGKAVHSVFEAALKGDSIQRAIDIGANGLTPVDQRRFRKLVAGVGPFQRRLQEFRRKHKVNRQLVEFRLGIREDFSASPFALKETMFRGIFDLAMLYDGDNLAVIDHKSGVRFAMSSIGEQLESYAVLASAHYPEVQKVWLGVNWVAHGQIEWTRRVTRQEINQNFLPSLVANIEAAALAVSDGPRANPGSWCQRCTYRSICPAIKDQMFEMVEEDDPDYWDDETQA